MLAGKGNNTVERGIAQEECDRSLSERSSAGLARNEHCIIGFGPWPEVLGSVGCSGSCGRSSGGCLGGASLGCVRGAAWTFGSAMSGLRTEQAEVQANATLSFLGSELAIRSEFGGSGLTGT